MGFFSGIGDFFSDSWDFLAGGTKDILGGITGAASSILSPISSSLSSLPIVGDLFSGLTSNASGLLSGGLNYLGQSSANDQNSALAVQQMAFQEKMRNTQYQAGMKDMKKAGLNPILAYKQGGASSPSGATAQMQNPMLGATAQFLDHANSAKQRDLMENQAKAAWSQGALSEAKLGTENELTTKTFKEGKNLDKQNKLLDAQVHSSQMSNEVKQQYLKALKKTGNIKSKNEALQYIDILTESIGKIFGSGQSARKLFEEK